MSSKSSSPPFLSVRLFCYPFAEPAQRSLLTLTSSRLKSVVAAPSKMRCLLQRLELAPEMR